MATAAVHPPPTSLPMPMTVSSSSSKVLEPDTRTSTSVQSRCSSSGSSEELTRAMMSNEVDSVEVPSRTGNHSSAAQSSIETPITSLNSVPSTTPSSPSSSSGISIGADSFKKSTLNPNAKARKFFNFSRYWVCCQMSHVNEGHKLTSRSLFSGV